MPLSFPTTPANGDTFVSGARTWTWSSAKQAWLAAGSSGGGSSVSRWSTEGPMTHASIVAALSQRFCTDAGVAVPLDAAQWTWVNQGAATETYVGGRLVLTNPSGGPGSQQIRAKQCVAPSSPFAIMTEVENLGTTNYSHCGLVIKDASSGRLLRFSVMNRSSAWTVDVAVCNSETSIAADRTNGRLSHNGAKACLAITYDGTTIKCYASADGRSWPTEPWWSETSAGFITTPNRLQLFTDTYGATVTPAAFTRVVVLNTATLIPLGGFG